MDTRMTRSLKAWPITAGLLVDLGGTMLFAIGYAILQVVLHGGGSRVDLKGDTPTTTDLAVAAIGGLLFVALGGYVAARMARVRPVAHGTGVGLGTLVVTLILLLVAPDPSTPLWFSAVSVLGVVPAGSLGGSLSGLNQPANTPLQPTSGAPV
jgi:hypothetical protein